MEVGNHMCCHLVWCVDHLQYEGTMYVSNIKTCTTTISMSKHLIKVSACFVFLKSEVSRFHEFPTRSQLFHVNTCLESRTTSISTYSTFIMFSNHAQCMLIYGTCKLLNILYVKTPFLKAYLTCSLYSQDGEIGDYMCFYAQHD